MTIGNAAGYFSTARCLTQRLPTGFVRSKMFQYLTSVAVDLISQGYDAPCSS